ncbi:hypothetical protein ACTNEO_11125 [Gracilibacillus sp. HCP3S3_G5_1]|uniref:hypothetical protein n=1 Tax=unclassified Gracilibacillus TaxID=2625209 RepID=UPI003F8A55CE
MKIDKLISWINISRLVFFIFILWLYIDSLLLKGNYTTFTNLQLFGNTDIAIPAFTPYQFTIIQTIPLFILVLLGTEKFISVLKLLKKTGTPFNQETITIFRKFSVTILIFGAVQTVLNMLGGLANLLPQNGLNLEIIIFIFPVEYVIGFLIIVGFAYIFELAYNIKQENNLFI